MSARRGVRKDLILINHHGYAHHVSSSFIEIADLQECAALLNASKLRSLNHVPSGCLFSMCNSISHHITRQKIWTKVGPAVIRNFDQCIPRCITITCSESTLMCCPMNSIELFPNLWTSINFSLGNIINFDQMCQYRPKSSIWKTPTWREKRSKNYFKQINISNYVLLSTFLMTKTKFYILMTSALFFIRK